jgi:hypothetical protein
LAVLCASLAVAAALLWFWRLDPWIVYDPSVGYEDDTSYYLVLGQSLGSGHGYRLINQPGEPWHRLYPAGYPLIVAAALRAVGNGSLQAVVVPLKVLSLLFALAALPLFVLYGLRRGERPMLLGCAAVLAMLHPLTITYADAVMSETAFMAASLLALFLCERFVQRADAEGRDLRWGEIALLAAAATASFYLRSVGVTLVAAVLARLLLRGRGRDVVGTTGGVLVLVLPWALMTFHGYGKRTIGAGILVLAGVGILAMLRRRPLLALGSAGMWLAAGYAVLQGWGGGPGYTYVSFSAQEGASHGGLIKYAATVAGKAWAYAALYGKAVLGGHQGWLDDAPRLGLVAALVGAAIVLLGYLGRIREGIGVAEIYVGLYTLLLFVTEPSPQIRYVVPLLPFLFLYFLRGVDLLLRGVSRVVAAAPRPALGRAAAALVTAVLVAGYVPVHAHLATWASVPMGQRGTDRGAEGWWEAVGWVRGHVPGDAVVMSRYAGVMYLYSGRKTVRYLIDSPPEATAGHILEKGVNYIVEDGFTSLGFSVKYLKPALAILAREGKVELVHATGGPLPSRIWRVNANHREARRG